MNPYASFSCFDLQKTFGGNVALAGVSLSFPQEGICAIVGPNGAGKTTLINVLSGFLIPERGSVVLGSRNITRLSPHKRVHLGIARTFQQVRIVSQLSVIDNLLLVLPDQKGERFFRALLTVGNAREEKLNFEKAAHFLDLVGLGGNASQAAGELSYGQQKLLSLACCLATNARILLLDEPIAGVHPEMIKTIFRLLDHVRRNQLVVFIEHDLHAVRRAADEVIVMDRGLVIAQGPPGRVLSLPRVLDAFVS